MLGASLKDMSHQDMINLLGPDAGAPKRFGDRNTAKVNGLERRECT
jgi:hypothetical protein